MKPLARPGLEEGQRYPAPLVSAVPGHVVDLAAEVFRRSPLAVALVDPALCVEWLVVPVDRRAVWDAEAITGLPVVELLPEAAEPALRALAGVLDSGLPFAAEAVPLSSPGGMVSYWDVHLYPVVAGETPSGILVLASEVTGRVVRERHLKEHASKLEEQSRLQGDFLSVASHELKAPLMSLVGYAELLEENLAGILTEEQADFVRHLHVNAQRLQRIVEDILDFTRYETGTFQLDLKPSEMREIVEDAVEYLKRQAKDTGIALEWAPPPAPIPLRADPIRLGQVLLNLVGNALKFTGPGGKITVTLKASDGKVRVEIRDTGIGISRSHLSRLFDKFYQVSPKRSGRQGVGLGLAICKALIEAHGGQIGVRSRPGRGSTFWFCVPVEGPVDWRAERQLKLFA